MAPADARRRGARLTPPGDGSIPAAGEPGAGDATVLALSGRVRLISCGVTWEGRAGDLLAVPPARHALEATEDAAVLLTVAKPR